MCKMQELPRWLSCKEPACRVGLQVQSRRLEDPLEEGTATHSDILAWIITWTEKPGGLQPMGSQKNQTQLNV